MIGRPWFCQRSSTLHKGTIGTCSTCTSFRHSVRAASRDRARRTAKFPRPKAQWWVVMADAPSLQVGAQQDSPCTRGMRAHFGELGTMESLLGHSTLEITREIYFHAITEEQRRAVESVERLVFGRKWTQVFASGAGTGFSSELKIQELVVGARGSRQAWISAEGSRYAHAFLTPQFRQKFRQKAPGCKRCSSDGCKKAQSRQAGISAEGSRYAHAFLTPQFELPGMVGARRFELRTSCAQGRRATRLRYAPTENTSLIVVCMAGRLPVVACVLVRRGPAGVLCFVETPAPARWNG